MFEPKKEVVEHPKFGDAITRHLEGTIVESVHTGYGHRKLVEGILAMTPEMLEEIPGMCWLLDLSAMDGFDSDCRVPAIQIFRLFRERGGDRFAVVGTSGAARLLLATVAFATRMPLKLFDRREDALTFLRARNEKRRGAA